MGEVVQQLSDDEVQRICACARFLITQILRTLFWEARTMGGPWIVKQQWQVHYMLLWKKRSECLSPLSSSNCNGIQTSIHCLESVSHFQSNSSSQDLLFFYGRFKFTDKKTCLERCSFCIQKLFVSTCSSTSLLLVPLALDMVKKKYCGQGNPWFL